MPQYRFFLIVHLAKLEAEVVVSLLNRHPCAWQLIFLTFATEILTLTALALTHRAMDLRKPL